MAPLTSSQISEFAKAYVQGAHEEFMGAVDRHNSWDFARRPQDLLDLIALWNATHRLGTREEQIEANISSRLKDDP